MDAVEFLKVWRRLCKSYESCRGCPLYDEDKRCMNSYNSNYSVNEVAAAVRKWAAEHPVKTRKDEFLKKYPNALCYKDETPSVVPCAFDTTYCKKAKDEGMDCMECARSYWNEEI